MDGWAHGWKEFGTTLTKRTIACNSIGAFCTKSFAINFLIVWKTLHFSTHFFLDVKCVSSWLRSIDRCGRVLGVFKEVLRLWARTIRSTSEQRSRYCYLVLIYILNDNLFLIRKIWFRLFDCVIKFGSFGNEALMEVQVLIVLLNSELALDKTILTVMLSIGYYQGVVEIARVADLSIVDLINLIKSK